MTRPAEEAKIVRLQFEVPENRSRELDELMHLCGLEKKKDLFNNALSLLEWAVEEVRSGRVVAGVDRMAKQFEVLRMPILDQAAKHRLGSEVHAT